MTTHASPLDQFGPIGGMRRGGGVGQTEELEIRNCLLKNDKETFIHQEDNGHLSNSLCRNRKSKWKEMRFSFDDQNITFRDLSNGS